MNNLNLSHNLVARRYAGWACRGVASTRSRVLILLASWPAVVTPLHADNPPTYVFEIDASSVPGGFDTLCLALDGGNNVYASDVTRNRIVKFSSGNYLAQWGSYGSGNGQFEYSVGIAVDNSNNVYVTDFDNDRVDKFDNNDNYLTRWGSEGTDNGQFEEPDAIAVDSTRNFIYVADSGNDRIDVFVNNANIIAPIITSQPASQTAPFDVNVTFSVGVVSAAPFAYQWSSNDIPISSATNAIFTLTNVSFADSGGAYSVLVSNIYGSELSSNAVLTVVPNQVTTLPSSSISAAGAVLNGSIILGSDETVAWFEWGTDTNYGNIAGDTIVPGYNGSNSISAALTGLPGNIYHYRLDASNDFEFVYGQDQSFTVGFAPSATTLPPTNSATGTTFEALVNPEGWGTTVYFQWGTTTLTNTTPGINLGAGATSLNVSSFVVQGSTPLVVAGGGGGGGDCYGYVGNGNVGTNGSGGGGYYSSPGGYASDATGGAGGTDGGGGGMRSVGGGNIGGGAGGGGFVSYGDYGAPGGYGYGYGGGGGSIIDSSAITNLTGISGIYSPDDPTNGEIIIICVPTLPPAIISTRAAFGFANGVFGFDVTGPSGSNVVIQASTDLQTWLPLQTNLLGSGPIYFFDPQSTTNNQRFYRAEITQ